MPRNEHNVLGFLLFLFSLFDVSLLWGSVRKNSLFERSRRGQFLFSSSTKNLSLKNRSPSVSGEKHSFVEGKTLYMRERFSEALQVFLSFIHQHKSGILWDEACYYAGLCYRSLGDFDKASLFWGQLIYRPKCNLYAKQALLAQSDLNFERKDYYGAMRLSEMFLKQSALKNLPEKFCSRLLSLFQKFGMTEKLLTLKKQLSQTVLHSTDRSYFDRKMSLQKNTYLLQMGSFKQKKNAMNLKKLLKRKGFFVDIVREKTKNQVFYKVCSEPSNSLDTVEKLQHDLLTQQNIRGRIVSQKSSSLSSASF